MLFRVATIYFYCFIFTLNLFVYGQKQNNQWRFGNGGAIDFNTNPPSFLSVNSILTNEGSASIADQNSGQLLFYTDGITVWNSQDQIMQNGTGLLGGSPELKSSTTAAVIVPKPGSTNLYYIFTIDEQLNNGNGLRYSIVDMNQNNGLGAVLGNEKNVLIKATDSEKIEVIPASGCTGYWIITKDNPGNTYFSYLLTANGLEFNPVVSVAGGFHGNGAGHLKANRAGTLLACGNFFDDKIELNEFDATTGIVSNFIAFNAGALNFVYGLEFSPNGQLLYASDLSQVVQFDISQLNQISIENSFFQIISSPVIQYASLQLAPNGKIYVNSGSIDAINSPNSLGAACDFQAQVFPNQTSGGGYGLPKFNCERFFQNDAIIISTQAVCSSDPVSFSLDNTQGIDSVFWNFGDAASSSNEAIGYNVSHIFSSENEYTISAYVFTKCGVDTLTIQVLIPSCTSDFSFNIPNVITANQDGINDFLVIENSPDVTSIVILNRWGNIVYSAKDYQNNWDGKDQNGQQLKEGVYTYRYEIANSLSGHGFVHLVR
jgi:gliding motility-associated-like protein